MDKGFPSNLYIMQARLCRDPWYNFESIFLLKEEWHAMELRYQNVQRMASKHVI